MLPCVEKCAVFLNFERSLVEYGNGFPNGSSDFTFLQALLSKRILEQWGSFSWERSSEKEK
jgi:hypothetical protein